MQNSKGLFYSAVFAPAVLATGFLLYNMAAIAVYRKQIFLERGTLSGVELVILAGFVLVLLFDIASFLWVFCRVCHPAQKAAAADKALLAFGALCIMLLCGEKTMVDEIGREYLLGWEMLGEWIILYVFLTTQLAYNLAVILRLFRVRRTREDGESTLFAE
jgi:hypothetical protein